MSDWRCRAGHLNPRASKACEECGEVRGRRRASQSKQKTCDCGASVLASGLCSETGCYPASMLSCPLACPVCRNPLEWDGGCFRCYGALDTRRRVEWCFPGDRYEVQGLHRVKIEGPRQCCSPEENRAAAGIAFSVASRQIELDAGLGLLEEIMAGHGGLPEEAREPGEGG